MKNSARSCSLCVWLLNCASPTIVHRMTAGEEEASTEERGRQDRNKDEEGGKKGVREQRKKEKSCKDKQRRIEGN